MASMRCNLALPALLVLFSGAAAVEPEAPDTGIAWVTWSDDVFARAKRENRLVLLDLEAVWCHWCHVMAATTYRDEAVVARLRAKYLCVRVDADARPDLANRYEDYGWPATVIFAPDGTELVKFRGYIPPLRMANLLQAVIDDPTPGPSVTAARTSQAPVATTLKSAERERLHGQWLARYDREHAGWGTLHKYLDGENLEYALVRAAAGDADAERMARDTLAAARALIDPVWGGIYQYSTGGGWSEPHFEKIMSFQTEALRSYAQAWAQWRDPAHLAAAQDIQRYLTGFLLGADGAFLTSQDADLRPGEHSAAYFALDDAGRRALGVPRIDSHRYARENGWAIAALAQLHAASGDQAALATAVRAADWTLANRLGADGRFRHDQGDAGGTYLGDTVAMARALLALYTTTSERRWLERAQAAVLACAVFSDPAGGYRTALGGVLAMRPQRDENLVLARIANLIHHHTGDARCRVIAEHALRAVAAEPDRGPAGLLLATDELAAAPRHLTVVGARDDARSRALHAAAIALPGWYQRIDWQVPGEPPPPGNEVAFPSLTEPAAFLCTGNACSPPARSPAQLAERVAKARR